MSFPAVDGCDGDHRHWPGFLEEARRIARHRFSYTKSSAIAQLNLNSTTVYRKPAFEARLTASGTLTKSEDNERDDRGHRPGVLCAIPGTSVVRRGSGCTGE